MRFRIIRGFITLHRDCSPNTGGLMGTRRKHQKMLREKWGRERVLDERREAEKKREEKRLKRESEPPSPEDVMWREFIEEERRRSSSDKWRDELNKPIPHHLIGLVTHPVPEFTKSKDYPHQPLSNPSHLWCDAVHATDADVRKGNPTKAID